MTDLPTPLDARRNLTDVGALLVRALDDLPAQPAVVALASALSAWDDVAATWLDGASDEQLIDVSWDLRSAAVMLAEHGDDAVLRAQLPFVRRRLVVDAVR